MSQTAVEMRDITKRFGDTVANDGVDLSVEKGEIHCLLGENGAGKTTLMKVLFGLYERDRGRVSVHGREVEITEPSRAIELGIGMIHQNFMLTDRLTVTENIMAGSEPSRGPFLDLERARDEVESLSEEYGLAVDPEARVEEISVGDQQRVEILKALYREAEILILDEPTAVLTPQEVEELFGVMRELRDAGKTLVFITHKLKETMAISDRITVLRDGKDVGTVETEETDPEDLARMMVGRDVILSVEKDEREEGPVCFRVEDLSLGKEGGKPKLRDVNFEIEEGEILGLAGVEGNGQLELEEALTGLLEADTGRIYLDGEEISDLSTRERRELGIAHIPSDRLKRGLVPEFGVGWNLILGSEWKRPFASKGLLDKTGIEENRKSVIEQFDVRGAEGDADGGSLSGGNQQKLILGRELTRDPEMIVAAQPTRGVDVGAKEYIHRQLLAMRDEGIPILLISAELDELRTLSDRLMVIYEGEIVATVEAGELGEDELGLLMAGEELEEAETSG